ncbi:MAG: hypothetical protein ACQEWD_15970 [Bacteroidota bacterium]
MKRFYSLSLVLSLVVLMTGCKNNNNANRGNTNTQSNDQNTQTKISKKNNDTIDLKQRTGIPFQISQATQDTVPLLGIMSNLEKNLAVVQAGIWRGDYQIISEAANAIVNHGYIPKREIQKIQAILGKEGLKNFVAADKNLHNKAKELAQAANDKKMDQIVIRTTELIQRCSSCHAKYRVPLRDNPKWLER